MIDLLELKKRLARPRPGRAILFTGAGFSAGAKNSLNESVPLALQLPFLKISESMGNHDSKIVDADGVD